MIYSRVESICMLSTHGYFDPVPQLGRTDTGGQVVYVLELAKALTAVNIKIDIYTRWFDKSKPQIEPVPGWPDVRIIRIPAGPWTFIPKEKLYHLLPELSENMIAFIQRQKPDYDLYHGHYVDAGIVMLDLGAVFSKPVFFTPHSIGAWKRERMGGDSNAMEKKFKFKHRIAEELRIFRSVRGLAVTSITQEEKINTLYGFTSDRITLLPPGTNIHSYHPYQPGEKRAATKLPNPYIFCLSRIDSNKGHDLLLNAFTRVNHKRPEVHLVIGGGSPQPEGRELEVLGNIKKIIREKGLSEKCHVIGYVPDDMMAPYYRNAELFVLPSLFEPFGMTASEAMACGTPVVASKFGGIKNMIVSETNGLLVDPTQASEFADAILRLWDDKDFARRLGQNGCQTIRDQYSWEAIAQRHMDFYQNGLARN